MSGLMKSRASLGTVYSRVSAVALVTQVFYTDLAGVVGVDRHLANPVEEPDARAKLAVNFRFPSCFFYGDDHIEHLGLLLLGRIDKARVVMLPHP